MTLRPAQPFWPNKWYYLIQAEKCGSNYREGGNLANIQDYPYVTNGGEIETNIRVHKVDSLLTSIAFPSHKNGSFKWELKLKDLRGRKIDLLRCAWVAAREEMSEFHSSAIHLDNLRERRPLTRSEGDSSPALSSYGQSALSQGRVYVSTTQQLWLSRNNLSTERVLVLLCSTGDVWVNKILQQRWIVISGLLN